MSSNLRKFGLLILAVVLFFLLTAAEAEDTDDFLIDEYGVLNAYTGTASFVAIPDAVEIINSYAFENLATLTSVKIGPNVKTIYEYAFSDCSRLAVIEFLGEKTAIRSSAFYCCGNPTVRGRKGSTAESYCTYNNLTFEPNNPKPDSISIVENLSIEEGQSATLTAAFSPSDAWSELTWTSSDENTVYVYNNGDGSASVYAYTRGTATVTVTTAEGLSASAQVIVSAPLPTRVDLNKSSVSMLAGETEQLTVSFYPSAADAKLTWSSSDPEIASVDDTGLVTANAAGKSTITVTTENGLTDSVSVSVSLPDLEEIQLSETGTIKIIAGKKKQIKAAPVPAYAWFSPTWKSEDESIAAVSEDGLITAVSPGTTTVTVSSYPNSGSYYSYYSTIRASVTVEVIRPAATSVTLNKSGKYTLYLNKTLKLKAKVKPSLANQTVTWKSSKSSVAKVDKEGKVTPLKPGTAVITATAASGVSAKLTVKVIRPKPTRITLDKSGKVFLKLGKSLKLKASLKPAQAEKKLTWKSSSPSVASVDNKGKVKGLSKGMTTITVKTSNGKKDSVKIQVYDPKAPDSISIKEGTSKTLFVGMKAKLTAVQNPSVCTSPLTWASSDPSVVSVDAKGNIVAQKVGSSNITVTTANNCAATITINVGRNIADNLREAPHFSIISYGQEIYLKSVEIVSPDRVDCEYYLVFNHISGLTTKWFTYIKARIEANGQTVASGTKEFIRITLRSPGVKLFKISFTGNEVLNTNVNLNAVRNSIYSSDRFYLEWNY